MRTAIRWFRPGGGSSIPGRIAARIQPRLVGQALGKLPLGVVLVSGSAGKSSTTKFLVDILRGHGVRVLTNPSTSNIRQGFFSAVLTQADWFGRIEHEIAVIEADEGHGPQLAQLLKPRLTILTNLMSDQLDRFVDPELVVEKLISIARHSDELLINTDDTNLRLVAERFAGSVSGIASSHELQKLAEYPAYAFTTEVPSIRIPVTHTVISCNESSFTLATEESEYAIRLATPGVHMALNSALAIAGAAKVLSDRFEWQAVLRSFENGTGVFARWESVEIRGVETKLVLVQNPGSFKINLALVDKWPERVFIGIGRDVHDPSWLWTVDMSGIPRVDVLGGFNSAEMSARLLTAGVAVDRSIADIPEAVEEFLSLRVAPNGERIMIITADAMRRLRRHLRLAK